jgi:osmoprotectant transport system permease protein
MTVDTPARPIDEEQDQEPVTGSVERGLTGDWRKLLRYLGTPILLGGILVVLYFYVSAQELDSIEARRLNWPVIEFLFRRHLYLVGVSTAIVLAIGIPLGVIMTRPFFRRYTPPVIAIANIGQATPSIGVLVLLGIVLGFGVRVAIISLVAYCLLPILRNTMVGLQQVDEAVIESGRGMGMTKTGVLFKIELPLSIPVMLAGVRTALIINTGTATLATFINGRGLGDLINSGLNLGRPLVYYTGAILVAVLALTIDWLAGIAEDVLSPRGL